jgi:ribulose-phosphate 3-epimerase
MPYAIDPVGRVKVSASVLNADLSCLKDEVERARSAGVDLLHIDVMDGLFVPPMTFGDVVVKSMRKHSELIFDTHLMVKTPSLQLIENFAEAGSNLITIHMESRCEKRHTIEFIQSLGCGAGVAINPSTPVERVLPFLEFVSLVVIMSVNPGYGGQRFIPSTLDKIRVLKSEMLNRGMSVNIAVDGGINENTAPEAVEAGADILVAGTYLFNSSNMERAVQRLRGDL